MDIRKRTDPKSTESYVASADGPTVRFEGRKFTAEDAVDVLCGPRGYGRVLFVAPMVEIESCEFDGAGSDHPLVKIRVSGW